MNSIDASTSSPALLLDAVEGIAVPLVTTDPEALKALRLLIQTTPEGSAPIAKETKLPTEAAPAGLWAETPSPETPGSMKPTLLGKGPSYQSPPVADQPFPSHQEPSSPLSAFTVAEKKSPEVSSEPSPEDPALLEALRAFFFPTTTSTAPSQPTLKIADLGSTENAVHPQVATFLATLTGDEAALPALLPLLKQWNEGLKADAQAASPEAVQQIKTLLGEVLAQTPAELPGSVTVLSQALRQFAAASSQTSGPVSLATASPFPTPLANLAQVSGHPATSLPSPEDLLRQAFQTIPTPVSSGVVDTAPGMNFQPTVVPLTDADAAPEQILPQITPLIISDASADIIVTDSESSQEQPATAPEPANLGQTILQSLGTQSVPVTANITPTEAPVNADRVEQVSALMTEMADRVLVTDPLHGQTPEVRIKLADHVMPGTEVRVWREEGGQLRVEFDTTSGYWARVLNEASPLLTQRLSEKLHLPDAVQVQVHQQDGQPEDGRSRNRQNPWDLARQADDQ